MESREKVEVGDGYGNWLIQGGLSGMPVGTRLRVLSQEDNNNPRIFVHSGNDINETKYVKGKILYSYHVGWLYHHQGTFGYR